ncbi:MAG: TonB family protein [Gammaproteobacteria bacterium]|nr:MAG: TonB family protein [Gammaproteobacteria bacterium]
MTAGTSHSKAQRAAGTSRDVAPLLTLAGQPLLVLTHDPAFFATFKRVADPAHELRVVRSETDLASALMALHAGVVVLDTTSLTTPTAEVARQLEAQFPDVVLIVAGGVEEQAALATEITDGSIYRFLHKPVSEQRARLFVDAAWRRHREAQAGLVTSTFAALARTPKGARWWLLLALLGTAAAAGWFVVDRHLIRLPMTTPDRLRPAASAVPAVPAAAPDAGDAVLENLLARADHALAAGQTVTPPGASAADLYREALRRNARDPRALNGVEQVIDRLMAEAEALLQEHHLDGAQQLAEEARAISPQHPRVAFLIGQIGAQRERAVLDKAQRAAATGNVAGALAVLDDAARGGHRSMLVDSAREQLTQQRLGGVADFLKRARGALADGQLVEPAERNARFYIESPERADRWAAAAADAGAAPADVAALHAEAQRLRGVSKANSVAHLAQAFNARLGEGRLIEPAGDSAQFYLAKLVQTDPEHNATQLARSAFDTRLLDESRGALRAQDYALARRWLAEARTAGADPAAVGELDSAIGGAQEQAQRAASYVSASSLTRTRYVPPDFPLEARKHGLEGWVDVQFLVNPDGSVGDVTVVGAQPVGVFEQAALDAVRRWRYQPVMRAGQGIGQRARVRLRFAMQR